MSGATRPTPSGLPYEPDPVVAAGNDAAFLRWLLDRLAPELDTALELFAARTPGESPETDALQRLWGGAQMVYDQARELLGLLYEFVPEGETPFAAQYVCDVRVRVPVREREPLSDCTCWCQAPTVPTCRDPMAHLAGCPLDGSGLPVGALRRDAPPDGVPSGGRVA